MDGVRGWFVFEAVPVPESGGWLPEPTLVENSRVLTRDVVRLLTLGSADSPKPTAPDSSFV